MMLKVGILELVLLLIPGVTNSSGHRGHWPSLWARSGACNGVSVQSRTPHAAHVLCHLQCMCPVQLHTLHAVCTGPDLGLAVHLACRLHMVLWALQVKLRVQGMGSIWHAQRTGPVCWLQCWFSSGPRLSMHGRASAQGCSGRVPQAACSLFWSHVPVYDACGAQGWAEGTCCTQCPTELVLCTGARTTWTKPLCCVQHPSGWV